MDFICCHHFFQKLFSILLIKPDADIRFWMHSGNKCGWESKLNDFIHKMHCGLVD
jgi:hypothetical protein